MINRRPASPLYIVSQDDLDTIDYLIVSLSLAISQIFETRKLHDPRDREEEDALAEFEAHIEEVLLESQKHAQQDFEF